MALPEQVRKQSEAVQQLYQQLNGENGTGAETPPADGTSTPPENATPPAADSSAVTNEASTPPANEQAPGAASVPEENIVQKYRTLQGMYNAEVPRLHQQNREMSQRVQHMEQLLASLSAQQQHQPEAPQPAAQRLVTDKEVEEYGDSLEVMRKITREELGPVAQRIAQLEMVLRQMQSHVVPQVQAVAHRQHLTAEQKFWSDLASEVPDYRTINGNEAFQAWLLEADPLTGITRQTYLDDAQRSLDAPRVAAFFHTWLKITGQATVAQSNNTVPAANSELERQVAPGRSRGGGTPPPANKAQTYTPADIQKFFSDVRKGVYKGREAERDRIERDIFAAQRENRIQVNA